MENGIQQIKNFRDYAELAWASYFNLVHIDGQKANSFTIGTDRIFKDKDNQEKFEYYKALSKDYKDYFIYDDSLVLYPKLNGAFSSIQAKNFAKQYEVKFHQPNTASGFSATLFYDVIQKQYILAFRGTELGIKTPLAMTQDMSANLGLTFGNGDRGCESWKESLKYLGLFL